MGCCASQSSGRVLLLGIDNAGKTTVLNYVTGNKKAKTIPTVGFNVEKVTHKGVSFLLWDVSGQQKTRAFWRHYYHGTSVVVFVVDSSDHMRFASARAELHQAMSEEELKYSSFLILCNKGDMDGAVTPEELKKALDLDKIPAERTWHMERTIAPTGEGIEASLDWISSTLTKESREA